MTTDVQRAVAFRRPDLPPKGIASYGHDHPLTPQEFQLRASLRRIQDSRWRLRKADPNSPEALRFARRLARAYKRWHDLYTAWVPGPSGYRPQPIRLMGWKHKPEHWDPPQITGHFSDPLALPP
jgi:hypothetical protein